MLRQCRNQKPCAKYRVAKGQVYLPKMIKRLIQRKRARESTKSIVDTTALAYKNAVCQGTALADGEQKIDIFAKDAVCLQKRSIPTFWVPSLST